MPRRFLKSQHTPRASLQSRCPPFIPGLRLQEQAKAPVTVSSAAVSVAAPTYQQHIGLESRTGSAPVSHGVRPATQATHPIGNSNGMDASTLLPLFQLQQQQQQLQQFQQSQTKATKLPGVATLDYQQPSDTVSTDLGANAVPPSSQQPSDFAVPMSYGQQQQQDMTSGWDSSALQTLLADKSRPQTFYQQLSPAAAAAQQQQQPFSFGGSPHLQASTVPQDTTTSTNAGAYAQQQQDATVSAGWSQEEEQRLLIQLLQQQQQQQQQQRLQLQQQLQARTQPTFGQQQSLLLAQPQQHQQQQLQPQLQQQQFPYQQQKQQQAQALAAFNQQQLLQQQQQQQLLNGAQRGNSMNNLALMQTLLAQLQQMPADATRRLSQHMSIGSAETQAKKPKRIRKRIGDYPPEKQEVLRRAATESARRRKQARDQRAKEVQEKIGKLDTNIASLKKEKAKLATTLEKLRQQVIAKMKSQPVSRLSTAQNVATAAGNTQQSMIELPSEE